MVPVIEEARHANHFIDRLDAENGTAEISMMDGEPNDESEESANQDLQEQIQDVPQSKLRDLRPERDPIGAGRKGGREAGE